MYIIIHAIFTKRVQRAHIAFLFCECVCVFLSIILCVNTFNTMNGELNTYKYAYYVHVVSCHTQVLRFANAPIGT